jgi:hypothetical protein
MATAMAETKPGNGKGKGDGKATLLDSAKLTELRDLGFRVEKLGSGWSAYEIKGDRKFGPASSMNALSTQVKLALEKDAALAKGDTGEEDLDSIELEKLETTSTGQMYAPGMEPEVIPELSKALISYHKIKLERVSWSNKETEAKKTLRALLAKYDDKLNHDEESGLTTYQAGDVQVTLSVTETEKLETTSVAPEGEAKPKKSKKSE